MPSHNNKILTNYKNALKKSKSVIEELEELGLLNNGLCRTRKYIIPTAFDYGMMPTKEQMRGLFK